MNQYQNEQPPMDAGQTRREIKTMPCIDWTYIERAWNYAEQEIKRLVKTIDEQQQAIETLKFEMEEHKLHCPVFAKVHEDIDRFYLEDPNER